MPKISIYEADFFPVKRSVRITALKEYGGMLYNLWDSPRLNSLGFKKSRIGSRSTRKDFRINSQKNYKPWQYK